MTTISKDAQLITLFDEVRRAVSWAAALSWALSHADGGVRVYATRAAGHWGPDGSPIGPGSRRRALSAPAMWNPPGESSVPSRVLAAHDWEFGTDRCRRVAWFLFPDSHFPLAFPCIWR